MPMFIAKILLCVVIFGMATGAFAAESVTTSSGRMIVVNNDINKVLLKEGETHVEKYPECDYTPVNWLYARKGCTGTESYTVLNGKIVSKITERTEGEPEFLWVAVLSLVGMLSMVISVVLMWRGFWPLAFIVIAIIATFIAISVTPFTIFITIFIIAIYAAITAAVLSFTITATKRASNHPYVRRYYIVASAYEALMALVLCTVYFGLYTTYY